MIRTLSTRRAGNFSHAITTAPRSQAARTTFNPNVQLSRRNQPLKCWKTCTNLTRTFSSTTDESTVSSDKTKIILTLVASAVPTWIGIMSWYDIPSYSSSLKDTKPTSNTTRTNISQDRNTQDGEQSFESASFWAIKEGKSVLNDLISMGENYVNGRTESQRENNEKTGDMFFSRSSCEQQNNNKNIQRNNEAEQNKDQSESFYNFAKTWIGEDGAKFFNEAIFSGDDERPQEGQNDAKQKTNATKTKSFGKENSSVASNKNTNGGEGRTMNEFLSNLFGDEKRSDAEKDAKNVAHRSVGNANQDGSILTDALQGGADAVLSMFSVGSTKEKQNQRADENFRRLVDRARNSASSSSSSKKRSSQQGTYSDDDDILETKSFKNVASLFFKTAEEVDRMMQQSFQDLDLSRALDPTTMFYYDEYQDEIKTPSWKRRMHRFHTGVDVRMVKSLHEALQWAELSYEDSVEDICSGLGVAKEEEKSQNKGRKGSGKGNEEEQEEHQWEMIHCTTESFPGRPSHFLAVRRSGKKSSSWPFQSRDKHCRPLEVLLVVRGTKSIEDMLTDCLLEAVDYKGGKAHAGIIKSGRYLFDKYKSLLQDLAREQEQNGGQGKSKNKNKSRAPLKLRLVGHSLGAGAATIAGMEFHDLFRNNDGVDVSVVGFGCPAVLSKELSEETKPYVTTVVCDSDIVPRMSGATVGNLALNLAGFDWTPRARRDVLQALEELQKNSRGFLGDTDVQRAMGHVDSIIKDVVLPHIVVETKRERMKPVLYPPGKCVHFYRDGSGVSASYAPCTFFHEIDVCRTMVDDHLIDSGYRRIFLDVMRIYHNDHNFSFDKRGRTS